MTSTLSFKFSDFAHRGHFINSFKKKYMIQRIDEYDYELDTIVMNNFVYQYVVIFDSVNDLITVKSYKLPMYYDGNLGTYKKVAAYLEKGGL